MTTRVPNNLSEPSTPGKTGVVVLGATGSVGVNTLDVIERHPDRFWVVALTAHTQVDRMFDQCRHFKPKLAVMLDTVAAVELKRRLRDAKLEVEVLSGSEGLTTAATLPSAQVIMAAIVGSAGLLSTLAAVRAGKRVLLANKEPLVMCGRILIEEARLAGAEILPIDSEHNAIFQCMPPGFRAGDPPRSVRRIFLTCSGGPFLKLPADALVNVTPEQACAHPTWAMGRKISVDSATLMNKGLELIEACRLFSVTPNQVEIVIHPQSVIHSMVEYVDGAVLAQLSNPDMRIPIAHALGRPERIESGALPIDPFNMARLEFARPDPERFPCLALAAEAAEVGGTAPAILNAANEIAVAAFLECRIGFNDIARVIQRTMAQVPVHSDVDLETVLADDARARETAVGFTGLTRQRIKQNVS